MSRYHVSLMSFLLSTLLISCVTQLTASPTQTPTSRPTQSIIESPTPEFPQGATIKSPKDSMTLHSIPGGEFLMGTLEAGDWTGDDELPQHTVTLDGFWMDETEVTNAQYGLCVQDGACLPPRFTKSYSKPEYFGVPEFDHFPVVYVDWSQASEYCEWAGRRLPTEAEWEKAARGTDGRLYPWEGNAKGESFANFTFYMFEDPVEVKSYELGASLYRVFDMAGNVYEWVADWYSPDYYAESPLSNPTGPETGLTRVMRGGGWSSDWVYIRTASRMHYYPQDAASDLGFRCAQSQ